MPRLQSTISNSCFTILTSTAASCRYLRHCEMHLTVLNSNIFAPFTWAYYSLYSASHTTWPRRGHCKLLFFSKPRIDNGLLLYATWMTKQRRWMKLCKLQLWLENLSLFDPFSISVHIVSFITRLFTVLNNSGHLVSAPIGSDQVIRVISTGTILPPAPWPFKADVGPARQVSPEQIIATRGSSYRIVANKTRPLPICEGNSISHWWLIGVERLWV